MIGLINYESEQDVNFCTKMNGSGSDLKNSIKCHLLNKIEPRTLLSKTYLKIFPNNLLFTAATRRFA